MRFQTLRRWGGAGEGPGPRPRLRLPRRRSLGEGGVSVCSSRNPPARARQSLQRVPNLSQTCTHIQPCTHLTYECLCLTHTSHTRRLHTLHTQIAHSLALQAGWEVGLGVQTETLASLLPPGRPGSRAPPGGRCRLAL